MKKNYDVIIIGKGPAGISASLYLERASMSVLVLGKDFGSLGKAHLIENYYGFENPISGLELAENGVLQAKRLGVDVETREVTGISYYDASSGSAVESSFPLRFEVKTSEGERILSSSVLFAVGRQRKSLRIEGFDEYQGRGLSFCAVCDGFFYREKTVGVVGNGAYALSEVEHLQNIASSVILFTNGLELEEGIQDVLGPKVQLVTEKLTVLLGTDTAEKGGVVRGVKTEQAEYSLQGLFIAIGTAGAIDFAAKLGLPMGNGREADVIATKENGTTLIPGIYSAGDATGGLLQIAKAVSDGAHVASAIADELRKK